LAGKFNRGQTPIHPIALRTVANRGQIPIARHIFAGRVQSISHLGSDPYWRVDANGVPRPGYAPGRAVTFFCVAKRKSPKKRPPQLSAPSAFAAGTCGARFVRGLAKLACGSNNASPFPPKAVLLGAYRWGPRGAGSGACAPSRLGRETVRVASTLNLGHPPC
jgi:hypothetical protein